MCNKDSIVSFLANWRLWIRPFLITLYLIFIIVLFPILIVHATKNGFSPSDQGSVICTAFVLLALPIAIYEITQHIIHFNKPKLQKHIIRILWMVPIYALNGWFGFQDPEQSVYLNSIRECYEAYVIYNFMMFLLHSLNEEQDLEEYLESQPQVKHIFPLCYMRPWQMGREFVHNCKQCILQYTLVRPLTSIISVICELAGVYGESEFKANTAFPYIIAVNNLSQFLAMYSLVLFYMANKQQLQPIKPIAKFLCIKAVVFFSFFQSVIIAILVYCGVISSVFNVPDNDNLRLKIISSKLQNFLICIEMFLAAVAHHYSFSYRQFVLPTQESTSCFGSFLAMWDVSDVKRDISEHIGVVGGTFTRRLRGKTDYHLARGNSDENSRLVLDQPVASTASDDDVLPADLRPMTYGAIQTSVRQPGADPPAAHSTDDLPNV